jgi:hypothetical protein
VRNPDRYKEKKCQRCGNSHRKRGKFCSQSCASRKTHSEETKEKIAESRREYFNTPQGIAEANRRTQENINPGSTVNQSDFAVDIPIIPELPPGYDAAEDW